VKFRHSVAYVFLDRILHDECFAIVTDMLLLSDTCNS